MATLEEIMLGLKSQKEGDKKEGFSNALLGQVLNPIYSNVSDVGQVLNPIYSNAPDLNSFQILSSEAEINKSKNTGVPFADLLGQVTPTTPSEAGNKLLSPFGLSLGEQQPQPFGPVNQQAQPISILGQAPATPSGAVNQLRDEYRLGFADQQAQLNARAQAQPLGPQSPFLPSGEKAVYAMAPEEVAARQAGRNRLLDDSMIGSLANLVGDLVLGKDRGAFSGSLSPNLPPTFTPPSQGATPKEGAKELEPISLVKLGLESPQQAALRERFNPTQTLITPTFNSGVQTELSTQPSDTLQTGQVTPTIQSIAGVEQAPQPQATFTLPSGEVRSIMPGQDVASAFGRESGRPMTFQVDGGEVTVPSAQAIQTMNLGEQAAARRAQQEFLASPAAREMSNRMLQSVMNDPYAQASAQREARLAARPDFNRAVSDRERRGTGEMSMASATKLTGGDRDKARAMIELQRQGRDPMTGKEVEAPFEPKEIEIGGKKYIQYTPNYIQPVEEPKAPKKSEIESIREEGVKAGLPENLIRQSIANQLGLDIYDEGVKNWMAGNTGAMPSVEGASESSTPSADTESSDVLMIGTDGKTRKVPAKDKEAALKAGYTLK
jgi:hypothetical protein